VETASEPVKGGHAAITAPNVVDAAGLDQRRTRPAQGTRAQSMRLPVHDSTGLDADPGPPARPSCRPSQSSANQPRTGTHARKPRTTRQPPARTLARASASRISASASLRRSRT
jgi:hypothetical protein